MSGNHELCGGVDERTWLVGMLATTPGLGRDGSFFSDTEAEKATQLIERGVSWDEAVVATRGEIYVPKTPHSVEEIKQIMAETDLARGTILIAGEIEIKMSGMLARVEIASLLGMDIQRILTGEIRIDDEAIFRQLVEEKAGPMSGFALAMVGIDTGEAGEDLDGWI